GEIFQIDSMRICPVPPQPVPMLIGGHSKPALRRAALRGDGFIHAGGTLDDLKLLIDEIDGLRKEYGRDHLPFEYQSMGVEAFSLDGIKKLEDLAVGEAIAGFRNPYDGTPDTQTLEEKIDQINWFAENLIHKSR
ncbi:MAG: LLM class flavin-dependent oxidoreductase, partial [bacterium]|nr:LLM class flavin-dependent oxidoreductase [bacterium]